MSKIIKVFIDPGHGGNDPGAVANGLREKDLVLTISKAIKKYLEQYESVEVRLSREDDRALTLAQRTQMANAWGADIFISVHINAGGGVGFETFIFNGNVSAPTVANQNVIHAEIMKQIGGTDRGRKRANFAVLRTSNMPAILTEAAFIDNASDAKKLKDPKFLDNLALGHANGVVAVYGLKKKATSKSAQPTTNNSKGNFFRVVTGSFKDKPNAERQAKAIKSKGFDSFLSFHNGFYRVVTGSFQDRPNAEARVAALKKAGFDSFLEAFTK